MVMRPNYREALLRSWNRNKYERINAMENFRLNKKKQLEIISQQPKLRNSIVQWSRLTFRKL